MDFIFVFLGDTLSLSRQYRVQLGGGKVYETR